jgi:transcriptional regulator GlxA family with amidase domain
MAENGPVSMVSDKHMAWTSIEFAPDLLTSDFAFLNGRSGPRLEHGAMFRVAGTAAWDRLMDVCRTAFRVGMTDAAGFDPAPAATAASGSLIDAALGCLTAAERQDLDRAAAGRHHAILRRMIDAIEGDDRADLTVAGLCRAANVSAPTLHRIAAEFLGMPPARYLRCHRLTRLHQTLRNAAPGSVSIVSAMAHNGIWETRRATAAYRSLFGESPLETLNKVPRAPIVQ